MLTSARTPPSAPQSTRREVCSLLRSPPRTHRRVSKVRRRWRALRSCDRDQGFGGSGYRSLCGIILASRAAWRFACCAPFRVLRAVSRAACRFACCVPFRVPLRAASCAPCAGIVLTVRPLCPATQPSRPAARSRERRSRPRPTLRTPPKESSDPNPTALSTACSEVRSAVLFLLRSLYKLSHRASPFSLCAR